MMDEKKQRGKSGTSSKVIALFTGFAGILLFSYGTAYLQEQASYRAPDHFLFRAIFDVFGNVGLAVGFLVIGGGFVIFGYSQWKSFARKKSARDLYWNLAGVGLAVGILLANMNANFLIGVDESPKESATMNELRENADSFRERFT